MQINIGFLFEFSVTLFISAHSEISAESVRFQLLKKRVGSWGGQLWIIMCVQVLLFLQSRGRRAIHSVQNTFKWRVKWLVWSESKWTNDALNFLPYERPYLYLFKRPKISQPTGWKYRLLTDRALAIPYPPFSIPRTTVQKWGKSCSIILIYLAFSLAHDFPPWAFCPTLTVHRSERICPDGWIEGSVPHEKHTILFRCRTIKSILVLSCEKSL